MPISRAQPADLPELAELFASYLDFYQVPRPLPEVSAFLAARLERGDSVLFFGTMLPHLGHLQRTLEVFLAQNREESRAYARSDSERKGWQENADLRFLGNLKR